MIAFDSPDGKILRDIGLSRSATFAIWVSALEMNQMDWAEWARARPFPDSDPNKIALKFLHAAALAKQKDMIDFAIQLRSLPAWTHDLFYVRSARSVLKLTMA